MVMYWVGKGIWYYFDGGGFVDKYFVRVEDLWMLILRF